MAISQVKIHLSLFGLDVPLLRLASETGTSLREQARLVKAYEQSGAFAFHTVRHPKKLKPPIARTDGFATVPTRGRSAIWLSVTQPEPVFIYAYTSYPFPLS